MLLFIINLNSKIATPIVIIYKQTVRLNASNPFQTDRHMKFSQETLQYRYENHFVRPMRLFGINLSFRFGEMTDRIKT